VFGRPHAAAADETAAGDGQVAAPMPGRIVAIAVQPGDEVARGAPLVTLEAMKMEHALVAPFDARVAEVRCAVGEQTTEGTLLVRLEART
jgi:biotin carboxyl carrier protein